MSPGILRSWRYCPRCASELDRSHAPARVDCPVCGFVGHANSSPCVGVIVEDEEGRVLLARRAIDPYRGMWDTPGGYLEEGEHPVDGIHRELLEETGLTVEPGEFLGAFMDWYGDAPDANATLNLFWTASVVSGDPVPADDVAELRWFAAHEVPPDEEFAFTVLPSVLDAWRSR